MNKKFHRDAGSLRSRLALLTRRIFLLEITLGSIVSTTVGCGMEDIQVSSDPKAVITEDMLDTCTIVLPDCSREYRFLFLTDLHITLPSEEDGEDIHQYAVERAALFSSAGYLPSQLLTTWVVSDVLEPYRELLSLGKPVIVLLHVPLATDTLLTRAKEDWSSPVVLGAGNYGGIYPNETSTAFIELTLAENSPVVALFAGHVHFPDTSVLDGETEIVQYVGDAGYKGKGLLIQIVGE